MRVPKRICNPIGIGLSIDNYQLHPQSNAKSIHHRISYGQVKFNLGKNEDLDFLSIFNIESLLIWLSVLAFVLALILMLTLVKVRSRWQRLWLVTGSLFETDYRLTRKVGLVSLILVFYNIYFYLFKGLTQTNMKSSIIVLNTSSIVDNSQDLLNTDYLIW